MIYLKILIDFYHFLIRGNNWDLIIFYIDQFM